MLRCTVPTAIAVCQLCLDDLAQTLSRVHAWLVALLTRWVLRFGCSPPGSPATARRGKPADPKQVPDQRLCQPKPEWVRTRVLHLKALMPEKGCRKIAAIFIHMNGHLETVSKSYVANTLKRHHEEMMRLRAEIKHRQPRPLDKNHTWALDLTHVPGESGLADRLLLGILDHGTRACLLLREVPDKSTLTVLRALLDLFRVYGRPRRLRTDNEPSFRSAWFGGALALCGVRHQLITPRCPWQNGRIERFFATLKSRLLRWVADAGVPAHYQPDLDVFRGWYNHLRPHQHLGGLAPTHAWATTAPRPGAPAVYVSAWGGLLTGFHQLP